MNNKKINKFGVLSDWAPRLGFFAFLTFLSTVFAGDAAYAVAVDNADDIAENIALSAERLPGLITAISYMLALLFGVLAVLNLKSHVEGGGGQNGVPLRKPIIQLIVGGVLLALPILYEAMVMAINGGNENIGLNTAASPIDAVSGAVGAIAGFVPLQDINQVLENILESIENTPALITAFSYLLGLLLGVLGILKIKQHVESPDQVPLKDGVIRLLIGGALFAIPTIYQAMYDTIADEGMGGLSFGRSIFAMAGFVVSTEDLGGTCTLGLFGADLGDVLCASIVHTASAPAFMSAISYVLGIILGLWALIKLKDHVENPQQTKLSEGISRLIAGGMFFALPILVEVARSTVSPVLLLPHTNTGFNEQPGAAVGLSAALYDFMDTLLAPATILLNWFGYIAGMILIMIAVMRLIKSSQEGARGPGGIGTVMTFITGGCLISFTTLMTAFSTSFFNIPITQTSGTLQYTTGMTAAELAHAHIVISAVIKFMIILGLVSFIRGIFIIRDVAEGKQQSSIMAGATHMIGGALAVNLGPLLNAVQTTLGIVGFGVLFG